LITKVGRISSQRERRNAFDLKTTETANHQPVKASGEMLLNLAYIETTRYLEEVEHYHGIQRRC